MHVVYFGKSLPEADDEIRKVGKKQKKTKSCDTAVTKGQGSKAGTTVAIVVQYIFLW